MSKGKKAVTKKSIKKSVKQIEVKPPKGEDIDIGEVVRKLDRETADHSQTSTVNREVSAMSKKETKKESKKEVKKEKSSKSNGVDHVALSDIAKSCKVDARELRAALRSSKIKKPGGSWSWPKGHADIKAVEKLASSMGKK